MGINLQVQLAGVTCGACTRVTIARRLGLWHHSDGLYTVFFIIFELHCSHMLRGDVSTSPSSPTPARQYSTVAHYGADHTYATLTNSYCVTILMMDAWWTGATWWVRPNLGPDPHKMSVRVPLSTMPWSELHETCNLNLLQTCTGYLLPTVFGSNIHYQVALL